MAVSQRKSGGGASIEVMGSRISPIAVTASGGVTPGTEMFQLAYLEGSPGDVDLTANPQVAAGTVDGQELEMVGCNDSKKILFQDGNGMKMNGPFFLGADDRLRIRWDGANWCENGRREND